MEKLLSNQLNIRSVPESYIQPPEKRPGKCFIHASNEIPVIDLSEGKGQDQMNTIPKIMKACTEFGFFQVINHGIPEHVINDMLGVAEEFFRMPAEDKVSLYSEDPSQITGVYTSINYDTEEIHYWRDSLKHLCYPIEKFRHLWPSKPTKYRDVAGTYTMEVRKLGFILLDLICEGLGIEMDYFKDDLSENQRMIIHHYPPCPDPSLTLGLPKHCDPNLITLLHQGSVGGLQVLKNGEWIAVEPLQNAFVINLGLLFQIISNGMLRSAEHRVVTNSSAARTSIATFMYPSLESIVQPAKELVDELTPPKFRAFIHKEFHSTNYALFDDPDGSWSSCCHNSSRSSARCTRD